MAKNEELEMLNRNKANGTRSSGEQDQASRSIIFKVLPIMASFMDVMVLVMSASCVQLLEQRIPDFQLNMMRTSSGLIFFLSIHIVRREFPRIPLKEIPGAVALGTASFVMSISEYVAVTLVPVSSVKSIQTTSALALGIILFALFWNEPILLRNIFFAALCIAGVFLVIQPEFMFKTTDKTDSSDSLNSFNSTIGPFQNVTFMISRYDISGNTIITTTGSDSIKTGSDVITRHWLSILGYVLPVVAGFAYTTSTIILKRRPFLAENITKAMIWAFLFAVIPSLVAMLAFETPRLPSNAKDAILVAAHCSSFIIGWTLALYCVKYVAGNVINVIYSTSVVFMLISQYTVLSHILPGHRNWMEVLGVILVLLGSIMGSIMELWKSRKEA